MTYTAPNQVTFREKGGSLSSKICTELGLIDSAIDSAKIQLFDLTAGMGTETSLATAGVDIAGGASATTYYAKFFTPVAVTIVSMDCYFTEAYVKESSNATVVLNSEAASPVTHVTYTPATAEVAAKATVSTAPTIAAVAAGTALDLVVTGTASSSGTGHVRVYLRYTVN